MNRQEIQDKILEILFEQFEIENPGLDDDLREKYRFDSIDAIDLLASVQDMIGSPLSEEEEKTVMDIRTINNVIDWVEGLVKARP